MFEDIKEIIRSCKSKNNAHDNDQKIWFDLFFSNIAAISWRPILVVEEAGVPGENHRPWASNW